MSGVAALVAGGLRGRSRWGSVATMLVLAVAALAITAGLLVGSQGAEQLDRVASEGPVADLVLKGEPDALAGLRDDPRLAATAGPFPVLDAVDLVLADDTVEMQATALADPDLPVGRPMLHAGRWLAGPEEAVLERSLADDLGIGPGDVVTLRLGAQEPRFTVTGTAIDLRDCGYPQCDPGRMFVDEDGLARIGTARAYQLWAGVPAGAAADEVLAELQPELGAALYGAETWPDTRGDLLAVDTIFGQFVTAFGAFVLVAASVVVAGSTAARVAARRRELGLLGAVGARPGQVLAAIIGEHLVLGAVSVLVGWGLGGLLAPALQFGVASVVGAPGATFSVRTLVVAAVLVLGLLTLATLVPAWRAAHQPVTEVLRDAPPEAAGALTHHLPGRLGFLGVREAGTRPGRSLLTALAVTVAVVGTLVSVGFVRSMDAIAADPVTTGDPWDAYVVVGDADPAEVAAGVAATPGVASVFEQAERRATLEGGAFLLRGIGGDAGFELGAGRLPAAPDEATAGYGFLTRFGVEVGDEVTIDTRAGSFTSRVVGWYRDTEDNGEILIVPLDSLAQVDDTATTEVVFARAAPGVAPAELARRLQEQAGPEARVGAYESGDLDLSQFRVVLLLIAVLLAVVAGSNLLTSLLTTSRESARALGVQGALGFTPAQLTGQGAVAAGAIGVVAAAVGLPLGLWLYRWLIDEVTASIGLGPGVAPGLGWVLVVVVAVLAVMVGAGLGALATHRLARLPASDLVRWE